MDDKKEWEELKKWEENRKTEEFNRYGLNISDMNIRKETNKINKIVSIVKSFNIITILIFLFIVFVVVSMLVTSYGNFVFATIDMDIKKTMQERYNIDVTVWTKIRNVKEKYYFFKLSSNDNENIEFTAIKKHNKVIDDYIQRKHKYYFDLWKSKSKENFKVKEYEENEILFFETYIEDFDNIDDTLKDVIEFAKFCGNGFINNWEIYLKKGNIKIYPFEDGDASDLEIIKNTKMQYNKYFK